MGRRCRRSSQQLLPDFSTRNSGGSALSGITPVRWFDLAPVRMTQPTHETELTAKSAEAGPCWFPYRGASSAYDHNEVDRCGESAGRGGEPGEAYLGSSNWAASADRERNRETPVGNRRIEMRVTPAATRLVSCHTPSGEPRYGPVCRFRSTARSAVSVGLPAGIRFLRSGEYPVSATRVSPARTMARSPRRSTGVTVVPRARRAAALEP